MSQRYQTESLPFGLGTRARIFGILLIINHCIPGGFAKLPKWVHRVDSCPDSNNISQWMERSKKLNCLHNLTSTDPNEQERVYHCLPSSFLNETVEFCGRSVPIHQGNCPVYKYIVETNIVPTSSNCSGFTSGCPKEFFHSKFVYKYPNCLKINRKENCFEAVLECQNVSEFNDILDSTVTSTPVYESSIVSINSSTTQPSPKEENHTIITEMKEFSSNDLAIGLTSFAVIEFIIILIICVWMFRRKMHVTLCGFTDKGTIQRKENGTITVEEHARLLQNETEIFETLHKAEGHVKENIKQGQSVEEMLKLAKILNKNKFIDKLSKAMKSEDFQKITTTLQELPVENCRKFDNISDSKKLLTVFDEEFSILHNMCFLQGIFDGCEAAELFNICVEYSESRKNEQVTFLTKKIVGAPTEYTKVVYVINCPDASTYTWQDLKTLKEFVRHLTNASEKDVIVRDVKKGSVIVTFLIRNALISKILENKCQMSQSLKHEILKVVVGDTVINMTHKLSTENIPADNAVMTENTGESSITLVDNIENVCDSKEPNKRKHSEDSQTEGLTTYDIKNRPNSTLISVGQCCCGGCLHKNSTQSAIHNANCEVQEGSAYCQKQCLTGSQEEEFTVEPAAVDRSDEIKPDY